MIRVLVKVMQYLEVKYCRKTNVGESGVILKEVLFFLTRTLYITNKDYYFIKMIIYKIHGFAIL